MKSQVACLRYVIGIVAALGFSVGMASAGETATPSRKARAKLQSAAKTSEVKTQAKPSRQLLTGSHIPTSAKRMGTTADTPYPIYIIDGRDMARCGAGSVSDALKRCPAVR